ncbi:MAG: prepilin-type N-terminal cleavage/methylation domain-containing protein [Clostridia bacterium]
MQEEKKLTDCQGFTLIEILVSALLLTIFLATAGTVFFSGQNFFNDTVAKNQAKLTGDAVFEFMKEQLTFAGDIAIGANTSPAALTYFTNPAGYLFFKGAPAYNDDFYGENTLDYNVQKLAADQLELEVKILGKSNEVLYSNKETITMVNMTLSGKAISAAGIAVNPGIYFLDAQGVVIDIPVATLKDQAIEMRDYMIKLYTDYYNNKNKAPQYFKDSMGNISFTNDTMRAYILKTFYAGKWPEIPINILDKYPALTVKSSTPLYIMPFINISGNPTVANVPCTIYASRYSNTYPTTGNWTKIYLIYDHAKIEWKYAKTATAYVLTSKTIVTIRTQLDSTTLSQPITLE